MGASRFVGRVGGLAVALGVGAAVFSAGYGVAWASGDDPGGQTPASGSSDSAATSAGPRATRGGGAAAATPRAAVRTNRALPAFAPRVSVPAVTTGASNGPQPTPDLPEGQPVSAPTPAANARVAAADRAAVSSPDPVPAPSSAVTGVATPPTGALADTADAGTVLPPVSPIALAALEVSRRPLAAASVAGSAALVTSSQTVTRGGLSVDPTVGFGDGFFQGELQAVSASGAALVYESLGGSFGGKLDLGTVPSGPSTTDPQSFTILPYATWLNPGGQKGVEQFSVRVSERTQFDQFLINIPLIGLVAEPVIGLLQQLPLISTLLAPIIGSSLVARIDVDVAGDAPGGTPLAFTYDVTSFDGTRISTNFFPATGLTQGQDAPTVLNGPGLGSPGETDPYNLAGTFGAVPGVDVLRDAGYNVITWDPRGEFASGGVLQLDNPFFEGRDASEIITWAAGNPLVELDGAGDPKVGMVGGSYGGGIQMVTAATDPRVDAIVPAGNWYSLLNALYPSDVFKTSWALTLALDLFETGARINNQIYQGILTGTLFGFLSQTSQAVLASSGPTALLNQMQAPTLLLQGTVDALFTLQESLLNAQTIQANPFGTPVKLTWFCGGHGACLTGTPPGQQTQLFADTFAWLDQYVKGDGTAADAVPNFRWYDQKGQMYTSDLLPYQDGFNEPTPYTATDPGGLLGIVPLLGASGPDSDFSFPVNLITPTRAGNALNVALTPDLGDQIVGAPQLSFTYRGLGTSKAVFAQIIDDKTGLVVGNIVTEIPVTLDGKIRTASVPLNNIAYTVGAGDSLTLQIVPSAVLFANAAIGVIDVSDIQVDLPIRTQGNVVNL